MCVSYTEPRTLDGDAINDPVEGGGAALHSTAVSESEDGSSDQSELMGRAEYRQQACETPPLPLTVLTRPRLLNHSCFLRHASTQLAICTYGHLFFSDCIKR